jgi:hypothetical protein
VAEVEVARVAREHVEGEREADPHDRLGRHAQHERVVHDGRDGDEEREDGERGDEAAVLHVAHTPFANRPRGETSRMT